MLTEAALEAADGNEDHAAAILAAVDEDRVLGDHSGLFKPHETACIISEARELLAGLFLDEDEDVQSLFPDEDVQSLFALGPALNNVGTLIGPNNCSPFTPLNAQERTVMQLLVTGDLTADAARDFLRSSAYATDMLEEMDDGAIPSGLSTHEILEKGDKLLPVLLTWVLAVLIRWKCGKLHIGRDLEDAGGLVIEMHYGEKRLLPPHPTYIMFNVVETDGLD